MATAKITKRTVDAQISRAIAEGRNIYTWDEDLSGFGLLTTRTGSASYFVEYRLGGRGTPSKRMTIGKHGVLTPDEARKLAKDKLGEVAKGRDVAQEKQDAKRKLASGTFREACERWLKLTDKNSAGSDEKRRLIEHDAYPVLGNRPMTTITRGDVATLVDDVAARSQATGRGLFAAIRPFFKWARDRGVIEVNPIADLKGPAPLPKRKRVLSIEEVRALWAASGSLDWPFGPFYRLLILTGQRRDEVAALRWSEVNLETGVWRLPPERTKNGEEHLVFLPPQALATLRSLPGERRGFIFSTTGRTAISGFSKVKARVDAAMAAELGEQPKPWRNHDIRRTFVTMLNEHLHIAPHVVEAIVNHLSGAAKTGVAGVYNYAGYFDERKAAMVAWGNFIERLVSGEVHANVVALAGHC